MSMPSVPPILSVVPPSMLEPDYGFPLIMSIGPFVLTSSNGTSQTLSAFSSSVPISKCGILRFGVQPFSMIPLQIGSQPAKFTMPPIIMNTVISFGDQKRFKRFTNLGPHRFNGVVGQDACEFLMNFHEKLHNIS